MRCPLSHFVGFVVVVVVVVVPGPQTDVRLVMPLETPTAIDWAHSHWRKISSTETLGVWYSGADSAEADCTSMLHCHLDLPADLPKRPCVDTD